MKKLFLFLIVLCTSFSISAQTIITGKVTSQKDNSELPGVSVSVKGTALGTATDGNGRFSLSIPTDKAVLVFKYLGFKDQQVSISGNTRNLKVEMDENTQLLDEVVVIGYGTMRRSDFTGAVSSIGSDVIQKSMTTSVLQAMQGRLAGVQVTQNSGAPGGDISVKIRGISSLGGNEPLYVVDGVALGSGSMQSINPADITSLEVLKDASATAIYGSRAANGVVMITTKQGETGKPKLNYSGYYGLQQLPTRLETMNLKEYAEFYNTRQSLMGWGIREEFRDPGLLTNGTDWQKELFKTASMQDHSISIGGGSAGVKYMFMGGFLNQDGIGIASNFRRFTVRNNTDMEVTKWLNVGLTAGLANKKTVNTMEANDAIWQALKMRQDVPARNPDGSYGMLLDEQFGVYEASPLAEAYMRENYKTGTELNYNFYADIKPLSGLSLRIEYGGYLNYGNEYRFTPNYMIGPRPIWTSECYKQSSKSEGYTFKQMLTYDKTFEGKHNLKLMATHEAISGKWENLSGTRQKFLFNTVHSLNVGGTDTQTNGDGMGGSALESYLGRLNYNFDSRYYLTGSIRTDGSSTFGPDKRWGTFPSGALAWKINNESFLKDVEAINNLRLRASWGIVGKQSDNAYAYGVTMKSITTNWGTGFMQNNYGNPNLQWEQTKEVNVGLDFSAFKNRLGFIAEAYNKNTDNLLMQADMPTYAIYWENWLAISTPWVNAGAMNNKGLEFTLNTVNISKKDLSWSTGLTFSLNKNKLTRLYNDTGALWGRINGNGKEITKSEVGQPVGQIFVYNVIGMFTCEDDFYQKDANGNFILNADGTRKEVARPGLNGVPYDIGDTQIWVGDYIFEDVNKDGVIDEKDRKYLGSTSPKFTYGISNTLTWKDFDLDCQFYGVYGNKVYNVLRQDLTHTIGWVGKLKEVAGYARVEKIDPNGENVISNLHVTNAATATTARVNANNVDKNDNNRASSRFVEDGSYLRLANLSLTYTVPRQWLQRNLQTDFLQIFANVRNLITFTGYKGYDPEVGNSDIRQHGIDNARYPAQRQFNFGLRFNL